MSKDTINLDELTARKTSEKYPNLMLCSPNDTVPVVVKNLQEGDMQLIAEWNGKRKVLAYISPSAYNVSMLLRTTGLLKYNMGENVGIDITDVETYLSCVV